MPIPMEPGQAVPGNSATVQFLSEECNRLFDFVAASRPQWTEDQLARFRIWNISLGVFENGHASIEYRLRDHPDVCSLVTQQLNVLKANLHDLKKPAFASMQHHTQKKAQKRAVNFEIQGEEFIYESPGSEDSSHITNLESKSESSWNTKLLKKQQVVAETIGRLNSLSTAIRRSGSRSRTSKADNYEVLEDVDGAKINLTQEFRKYASAVVTREIPGAAPFLKERMAESISRRRNRLLYWKRYDKKSKMYMKKVTPSLGMVAEFPSNQHAIVPQVEHNDCSTRSQKNDQKTIMTSLTATTFDATNFRRSTASAMGSIKLTGSVQWKNKEDFPEPPRVEAKDTHFLCPICFILSPAEEARGDMWLQHVTRDLKPYICVLEDCRAPDAIFDNFQDWIEHMKTEQMVFEWYCASASHPPAIFDSQDLFETHMKEKHSPGFFEAQLPALSQRNMRFSSNVFRCCPFCSYEHDEYHVQHSPPRAQDELQHHISSHLLSLAFVSLPPMSAGNGDFSDSQSRQSLRASLDSRLGQFEPMDHLQFLETPHPDDLMENDIQSTPADWDWTFVWEAIGKRSFADDDQSSGYVVNRLQAKQPKRTTKEVATALRIINNLFGEH